MFRWKNHQILMAGVLLGIVFICGRLSAAPLSVDQLLDLERVGAVDISPDGKWAAYTVSQNRSLDDEAGGSWNRLYLIDTKGGAPRPFVTGEVSVGHPTFSPDGKFLAFTMTRGAQAKNQVWVIPVDGGESWPASRSATGVSSYAWSHDGTALFTIETESRDADEKARADKGWLPKWHEEGLLDRHLCRVPFNGREAADSEILVEGPAIWKLAVDPTGRTVVFSASEKNLVDDHIMFQDLYVLDLKDTSTHLLTDVPGKLGTVTVSPDGKRVAWLGAASRSDHQVSTLWITELNRSRKTRNLTGDDYLGHVSGVTWLDKNSVLIKADEGVETVLASVRVDGKPGNRKVLLDGAHEGLVFGMPAVRAGVRQTVLTAQSPTMPTELFAWPTRNSPRRLTTHNEFLADVALARQEIITWQARDGLQIEGILLYPVGYSSGRFPLIVDVHGGPEAHHRNGWISRYVSPGQVFCGEGFGVLFPNHRGSTGRGLEFAAGSFADPAGAEFDDIVDGVDHLIAQGLVDGDRVGVMGGSYGGYATNWLSTVYSDRFKAGVSFVGVSNLISKRFLTDIPYEDLYVHMGDKAGQDWNLLLERSPVTHAAKSKTPLLILHGDSDPRVHPSQSQELYRALKMAGHPAVRLVWYPGEGHGNRERFGRTDFVHRNLDWFRYYLLEDHPWDGPMPALDISEKLSRSNHGAESPQTRESHP